MNSITVITHEEIAARAHAIWDECGRPEGRELEHWLRAERELQLESERAKEFRAGLSPACVEPTATHFRAPSTSHVGMT
jgi:hypothetical protein